jgi:hypothetical protein
VVESAPLPQRKPLADKAIEEARNQTYTKAITEAGGEPVPLAAWFAGEGGDALFALPRHERLARVQRLADDALARIDEGTYGLCINCATLMTEKRLNAVPWAPYCLDCQELSEKGMLPN